MNTRVLGTLGMLASPMLFVSGVLSGFQTITANRLNGILGLIFILGWICSAMGWQRLKGMDAGISSNTVFTVQIFGLLLAGSQQVQEIVYDPPQTNSLAYQIADAAWPFSVLFMLVVGALTLVAKKMKGWLRYAPLLCGLALPFFILTNIVIGRVAATLVFGVYTMAAWMLLGYAVRKAEATGNSHVESSMQSL